MNDLPAALRDALDRDLYVATMCHCPESEDAPSRSHPYDPEVDHCDFNHWEFFTDPTPEPDRLNPSIYSGGPITSHRYMQAVAAVIRIARGADPDEEAERFRDLTYVSKDDSA